MAKISKASRASYVPKKTNQGKGVYTKKSHSGGETFYDNVRAGSPPSRARRNRKPDRGQGR